MPKSKEFFTLLKDQGKINNPKFDELIEKLPDFDIDEEAVSAFEEKFMTATRAVAHPDVKSQTYALALKPVNRELDKIISVISGIDKTVADKIESLTVGSSPDTYKRLDAFSSSLGDLFEKVKKAPNGDDELKKELEAKKKFIEDLTTKFTTVEKEYGEKLKTSQKDFEEKLHDYKLDSELEKMAGNYTLAEAYDKNRSAINKVILSELKSTNRLRLGSKDGQTLINVLDDNGEPRFNGNSPVQINSLLEEKYKPFLKQSNADPDPQQPKKVTVPVNGKPTSIRRGASTTVEKTLK